MRNALGRSNLGSVSARACDELLRDVTRRRIEPGATLHSEGEPGRHVHLVVSGLIRMVVRSTDGRTATVRYCRAGSLIGVASLFAPGFRLPVSIEAVTAVELADLRPDTVVRLAESDSTVARALLVETGERVQAFVEEIPRASFATVPQRVARHLLDLASVGPDGVLVADTSQEDLAAAVGTVREVAARAIRGLRDRGLIRTARSRIVVVDPDGLLAASSDSDGP